VSGGAGFPVIISGPAGSGKGTVVRALLPMCDKYALSVSMTTRAPRPGEIDGVNYWFVSAEEFKSRVGHRQMLEYTFYNGNHYGTPADRLRELTRLGFKVILEIETEGARNVRAMIPGTPSIFLTPPTFAELGQRLRGRGTESEENIIRRLERAKSEVAELPSFDYLIINYKGCAAAAAANIDTIIKYESVLRGGGADAEMEKQIAQFKITPAMADAFIGEYYK